METKRSWSQYEIIEQATLYEARGAILHPILEDTYFDTLEELSRFRRICLTPLTQLTLYTRKMRKAA